MIKVEGRRLKVEVNTRKRSARCARTSFLLPPSSFHLGVTLVELLITIAIISVLASLFIGVSSAVDESARAARTKSTINKIHGLLMENWADYATRRVDVNPQLLNQLRNNLATLGLPFAQETRAFGVAASDLRLLATRELMASEIPDRWSDIIGGAGFTNDIVGNPVVVQPRILTAYSALRNSYARRYEQLRVTNVGNPGVIQQNESAECLFLIVTLSTGDGEARSFFNDQDIGDTDGDGAQEFLDGWGRPIQFLRWAPGYVERSDLMAGDADIDHDPTDPFRRDQDGTNISRSAFLSSYPVDPQYIVELGVITVSPAAFRLVPLIYSTGPDGIADIDNLGPNSTTITSLDPYALDPLTNAFAIGTPGDGLADENGDDTADDPNGEDNSLDNITNHLQDNR